MSRRNDNVVVALVLVVVALIVGCQVRAEVRCEKVGGVYLFREAKCVEGIKEIRP